MKTGASTLQSLVQDRQGNNLNALRLLLAVLVILSHSFLLTTGKTHEPLHRFTRGQMTLGGLAVDLFFFISGLLITASWLNSRSMNDYLRRRVLRVVPGYVCALGFSFLIATCFAIHPFANLPARLIAFHDVFLLGQDGVKGAWIFPGNPLPHEGNGSLWTISREFFCYLLIAAIGLFGFFKHRGFMLAAFLLMFFYYAATLWKGGDVANSDRRFVTFFLCGTCAYLWRDKILIHAGAALVALAVMVLTAFYPPFFGLLLPLTACYLVLWAGFAVKIPALGWCDRTDLSYGTYLFAFPVQQAFVALGVGNPWLLFATATPLVVGIALVSWFTVEKPFLQMKSKSFPDHDPGLAIKTRLPAPIAAEAKNSW